MKIRPCELKDANAFIQSVHRHHKRVQGHRFSLRVVDDSGRTVGVAVVGRPVARAVDQREVLEVTRLATDGTKNACSMLYSAAARVGREMGYLKIQTYILESESGTSLKATGWVRDEKPTAGGKWVRSDGSPRRDDQPTCPKWRWEKLLR